MHISSSAVFGNLWDADPSQLPPATTGFLANQNKTLDNYNAASSELQAKYRELLACYATASTELTRKTAEIERLKQAQQNELYQEADDMSRFLFTKFRRAVKQSQEEEEQKEAVAKADARKQWVRRVVEKVLVTFFIVYLLFF